jgi:hypothetical protein
MMADAAFGQPADRLAVSLNQASLVVSEYRANSLVPGGYTGDPVADLTAITLGVKNSSVGRLHKGKRAWGGARPFP